MYSVWRCALSRWIPRVICALLVACPLAMIGLAIIYPRAPEDWLLRDPEPMPARIVNALYYAYLGFSLIAATLAFRAKERRGCIWIGLVLLFLIVSVVAFLASSTTTGAFL
jgi:cell division protein FtsW (lipid II flippase)